MARKKRKGRPRSKYYKDKYFLALYDNEDNLVDTFDNCHQLADWFETTYDSVVCGVGRCLSGYTDHLVNKGQKYKAKAENDKSFED